MSSATSNYASAFFGVKTTLIFSTLFILGACGGSESSNTDEQGAAPENFTVTAAFGDGGSVSPKTKIVERGATAIFDISIDSGFTVASASGCEGELSGETYVTGNINSNCTITIDFEPMTFTVTSQVIGEEKGSIHPSSQIASYGEQLTFELEPNENYEVGYLDGCQGELMGHTFQTAPLEENCELKVSFEHTLIAETWIIPDLKDEYGVVCDTASVFFVIPIELNDHQYQDLLVHYFCSAGEFQEYSNSPTPDALVALKNNGDGTFEVVNEQVFGQSHVALGGHARNFDRGDLTGNGLDDFAFAMNWEDGRSAEDGLSITTEPTILKATKQGKYEVIRLGERAWGHGVSIIPNPEGGNDALFAGFVGNNLQAFRYHNGQWNNVSNEYPERASNWAGSARSIEKGVLDHDSTFVAGSGSGDGYLSIDLWKRNSVDWSIADQFKLEIVMHIQMVSWSGGDPGYTSMVEFDNQLYMGGGIHEICYIENLDGLGTPGLAARMGMGKHKSVETFDEETVYYQDDFIPVSKLAIFELSDTNISLVNQAIINEHDEVNANFVHCRDLNNNGLTDIAVYGYSDGSSESTDGGRPLLYINNGQGKFEFRSLTDIPVHSHLKDPGLTNRFQGRMYDMNGNGIQDILLFGTATDFGSGEFQIHLLKKPFTIDSDDL